MTIKKSAILLMAITTFSVGLLLFTSYKTISATPAAPVATPAKSNGLPGKCCSRNKDFREFSPWNIVSKSIIYPEG